MRGMTAKIKAAVCTSVDDMATSFSANCLTVVDPTPLTTAALIESTSVSGQGGDQECEYVATKNIIKVNMLNGDEIVDTSLHYENQLKFATRDEAKKWILEKGKEKKCVMVSGKESRQNRIVLVCLRSGKNYPHRGKNYKGPENKTPKIYKPRTQKCECPFMIVIRKTKGENGVWKMKVANGCHNHEDLESPVVHPTGAKLKRRKISKLQMENCDDGHPAGAKRKRRKISKLQMENCDDGLVGVGVQGHDSTRPPPTPSQQPSHFSSPGPCTTQLSRNPVNLPETLNFTQMISSPSGHQDIGMMSWNGAASQMQPVSSSMRSPTPAITLALAAPQLPYGAGFNQGLSPQFYNQLAQVAQPPTSSTGHSTVAPNDPARWNFQPTNDRNYFS